MGLAQPSRNMRDALRDATAQAHDQLDGTMRSVAGWASLDDYARFLSLQYSARLPIEAWLDNNAPEDLRPPPQAPLIAQDLKAMGRPVPSDDISFNTSSAHRDDQEHAETRGKGLGDAQHAKKAQERAGRSAALGTAWVLAGSSLGNRAILGEIRRTAKKKGWSQWPARFLGDEGMLTFWKRLRVELEESSEMETFEVAIHSAASVFDHFIQHVETSK